MITSSIQRIFLLLFFSTLATVASSTKAWAADSHPSRVIALSPAITEIIFALGLQSHLVGTSDFSDFPKEARDIPSVGPYSKPNLEQILSLHPDLVLIPTEGPESVKAELEKLNLAFAVLEFSHLNDIPSGAVRISQTLGNPVAGDHFEKNWNKDLKNIESIKNKEKPQVLISVQSEPLIVAANGTFLNEMIEKCGGVNVFRSLKGYPQVSNESFLSTKFSKILLAEHLSNHTTAESVRSLWTHRLKKYNKPVVPVAILDPNLTTRPGPRLLQGLQSICKEIRQ